MMPFAAMRLKATAAGGGTDPDFASVVLLMHCDGADGGTVFTDVKGHTFSGAGPVTSTTSPKFGSASIAFGNTYLSTPASTDWDMGSGDFTCEGWAKTAVPGDLDMLMTNRTSGGSDRGPTIFTSGSASGLRAFCGGVTGTLFGDISGGTVPTSTWFHWAYTRSGDDFRLFLDGTQIGSTVTSATACGSGELLHLGRDPGTAGREWAGNMDDIRRTKGVARYTANFTPPTAAFPDS